MPVAPRQCVAVAPSAHEAGVYFVRAAFPVTTDVAAKLGANTSPPRPRSSRRLPQHWTIQLELIAARGPVLASPRSAPGCVTVGDSRLEASDGKAPANLTMEFTVRQCATRCMGQETCEKCGPGKPGHLPQTCAKNLAARQVEESNRVAKEQSEQRLVTTAACVASRKTAVVIALGRCSGWA